MKDRRSSLSVGGTNQPMDWGPGMIQRAEEKLSWALQLVFFCSWVEMPSNTPSHAPAVTAVSSLPAMPFLLWWTQNKLFLKVGLSVIFVTTVTATNEECNHWRLHDRAFLICFSSCYYRPSEIVQKIQLHHRVKSLPLRRGFGRGNNDFVFWSH